MQIYLVFLFLFLFLPKPTFAEYKLAGNSASLENYSYENTVDVRVNVLEEYLKLYDSPLAPYSQTFVREADKYKLDWRLVASISGVESTFGHFLPQNSYNAWGWGIYGSNIIYFSSFDQGIRVISKSLREDYINSWGAENVYDIGSFYAASPTWASRVDLFMNQITMFQSRTTKSLPLSL